MKPLRTTLLAAFVLILLSFSASGAAYRPPSLSPSLSDLVVNPDTPADSVIRVLIFLDRDHRDQTERAASASLEKRSDLIRSTLRRLQGTRGANAQGVEQFLQQTTTGEIKRYWITPAYAAEIPVSRLADLAALEGVRTVVPDTAVTLIEPVGESRAAGSSLATAVSQPLQQLNVPYLWQQGLTGSGRLICSFDTGVEHDHPALASKWRGNTASLSASWFSKVAPNDPPEDAVGHGTHTMGIMVGTNGVDTFGVAPGAEWISAGVIDQGRPLSTTISDILEAYQWVLNPDGDAATTDDVPDVILNSWGIPKGLFQPCDETFAEVIEAVESAGIVTIFAAGNEGPTPMSLRNPADMTLTPLTSFAVGAVDENSVVGAFSSRGPASCDQTSIKPEVVAPGVSIWSSYKDGTYRVLSGTSMAAPFIAGLVALMREYNPDVSVEEIKNALIASARDLGTFGQDNAYGYGLVDASQLLEYLPAPGQPEFAIAGMRISDDGIALPGELVGLQITLTNAPGNVETAEATLKPVDGEGVVMTISNTSFFFGTGGTAAVNLTPFTILFDSSLYHGQVKRFDLTLTCNDYRDTTTIRFALTIGVSPIGTAATQATDQLRVTVSDFGQFGLAPGSIYNIRGDGFRINEGDNLLYEAGVILGRNGLQLASAVRDSNGLLPSSDFAPVVPLSDEWQGIDNGVRRQARYTDENAPITIPITVNQETITYPYRNDNGLIIVRFWLRNHSLEAITGLHFGMLADFDLPGGGEEVTYDADMNMLIQQGGSGPGVALVGLNRLSSFKAYENGDSKTGFSRDELYAIISEDGVDLGTDLPGDKFFVVSSGSLRINPGDSIEVALAMVGGLDLTDIYANAVAARELFGTATDIDDGNGNGLPQTFRLHQNYPNPFNPATTIAFELAEASHVKIDVYNALGRHVLTLADGFRRAGAHRVEWEGTDRNGRDLASGVYLYRVTAGDQTQTRKMLLAK